MKITKDYLKKLIKEEIAAEVDDADNKPTKVGVEALNDSADVNNWKVNDFLEVIIDISEERSIEKVKVTGEEEVKKEDYKYTRGSFDKFKALVKIIKIAESKYQD